MMHPHTIVGIAVTVSILAGFWSRTKSLIIKLIGIKGVCWITASVFLWNGKIDATVWGWFSAVVCGLSVAQKWQGEKGGFNVPPSS